MIVLRYPSYEGCWCVKHLEKVMGHGIVFLPSCLTFPPHKLDQWNIWTLHLLSHAAPEQIIQEMKKVQFYSASFGLSPFTFIPTQVRLPWVLFINEGSKRKKLHYMLGFLLSTQGISMFTYSHTIFYTPKKKKMIFFCNVFVILFN